MAQPGKKMLLDAIDHVAISVKNLNQAVEWYTKTFKCRVAYQDDTWAYLQFKNIHLALVVAEQHPAHLGFSVKNADQYGPLKTHRDNTRSIYIKDPAGNAIELIDKV